MSMSMGQFNVGVSRTIFEEVKAFTLVRDDVHTLGNFVITIVHRVDYNSFYEKHSQSYIVLVVETMYEAFDMLRTFVDYYGQLITDGLTREELDDMQCLYRQRRSSDSLAGASSPNSGPLMRVL